MLRIFIFTLFALASPQSFGTITKCEGTAKKMVGESQSELGKIKALDGARSSAMMKKFADAPNIPQSGAAISSGAQANDAELKEALANNETRKKQCKEDCDPQDTQAKTDPAKTNESQNIERVGKDCDKKISEIEKQEGKGAGDNETADKKADATKKDSGGGGAPPPIPPMPPSSDDKKPETPPTADKPADSPAAAPPAGAPPPAASSPNKETGKADYKKSSTSPAAVASVCSGRNSSEIAGCPASAPASQPTTPASAFPSAGGGGGGSSSGGGSGGMSAASAAQLAAALGKSDTEKEAKSTGLKAASLNLGTDGGGGGGGGSGGGSSGLSDLDFGFKSQSARGPASVGNKAAGLVDASGARIAAPQGSFFTKAVSEIYIQRCKAGKLMHCGPNN